MNIDFPDPAPVLFPDELQIQIDDLRSWGQLAQGYIAWAKIHAKHNDVLALVTLDINERFDDKLPMEPGEAEAWNKGRISAVKTANQWEQSSRAFKLHVALTYKKEKRQLPKHYRHTIHDAAEVALYIMLLGQDSLFHLHPDIVVVPAFWNDNPLLVPAFQNAHLRAHDHHDVCRVVLEVNGLLLEHCSHSIRDEQELVGVAANNTLESLQFMSVELSNDDVFIRGLVAAHGYGVLAHCGTLFYNDAVYATELVAEAEEAENALQPRPGGDPLQYFSPVVRLLLNRGPRLVDTAIQVQRAGVDRLRERRRQQALDQRAQGNERGRGGPARGGPARGARGRGRDGRPRRNPARAARP